MDWELKKPMTTMEHLKEAIDWTSVRMNSLALLGLFSGSDLLIFIACLASVSTFIYNGLRIYKEFIKKDKNDKK